MMQNLIVALIVFAAAVYVARRYAPKRVGRKLSAWLGAAFAMLGWGGAAEVLTRESPAGKSCGSGCGSCGACGDESVAAAAPAGSGHAVIKIHRR